METALRYHTLSVRIRLEVGICVGSIKCGSFIIIEDTPRCIFVSSGYGWGKFWLNLFWWNLEKQPLSPLSLQWISFWGKSRKLDKRPSPELRLVVPLDKPHWFCHKFETTFGTPCICIYFITRKLLDRMRWNFVQSKLRLSTMHVPNFINFDQPVFEILRKIWTAQIVLNFQHDFWNSLYIFSIIQ